MTTPQSACALLPNCAILSTGTWKAIDNRANGERLRAPVRSVVGGLW